MAKLSDKSIALIVLQEPISKGKGVLDSIESKLSFRSEVKKQLDRFNIKPFKKDANLAVKITFYTSHKNKFLLHNLVKNYLDLLHKPLYSNKLKQYLDDLEGLLFLDDSQIRILTAEKIKLGKPQVVIQIYLQNEFYKRIDKSIRSHDLSEETNKEFYFGSLNSYYKIKELGDKITPFRRFQLLSNAQKEFLYKSQFNIHNFKYFLLAEIPSFKILKEKYDGDNPIIKKLLQKEMKTFSSYYRLKSIANFLIGFSSFEFEKTNKLLKLELKRQLEDFKKQHNFLFPFITPISLTVIVMQSKKHTVKDIDNLVKEYFIKLINTTFKAPEKPIVPFFELQKATPTLRKNIRGNINKYQILEIEYDDSNIENKKGWIGFYLGDSSLYKDIFSLFGCI